MPQFRVRARSTSYCYLDVEAEDEEAAIDIAKETDGGDFITEDEYLTGEWEVLDAEPIDNLKTDES